MKASERIREHAQRQKERLLMTLPSKMTYDTSQVQTKAAIEVMADILDEQADEIAELKRRLDVIDEVTP